VTTSYSLKGRADDNCDDLQCNKIGARERIVGVDGGSKSEEIAAGGKSGTTVKKWIIGYTLARQMCDGSCHRRVFFLSKHF
jgi:hypothetical protein